MSQFTYDDSMIWLRDLRHRMLDVLLGATVVLGTVGMLYSVLRVLTYAGDPFTLPFYAAAYALALVLLFTRRIPDQWRAAGFLAALYGFACFALYAGWLAGGGRTFLLALSVSAAVLIGPRAGIAVSVLSMLTYIGFGVAFNQGWLHLRKLASPVLTPPIMTEGLGFAIALGVTATGLWFFRRALLAATHATREANEARAALDEHARQLDDANHLLAERTHSAEVARQEADAARQAVETQAWIAAGQVQFNDALRGEQSLTDLANNALRSLCQYLDIPVAALFLLEGDVLRQVGAYALAGEALNRAFKLGEGLVGQAALEGSAILLDEIPAGAVSISSGLGEMPPRQILIQPFRSGQVVVGVIELGVLQALAPQSRQFLQQVESSLAVAFQTAQARQRVNELLAQTQRQAEELLAQEEELRAVNEELQAQADALRLQEINAPAGSRHE